MVTDRRLLAPMPYIYLVFVVCFHFHEILAFGYEWYCQYIQMDLLVTISSPQFSLATDVFLDWVLVEKFRQDILHAFM